MFTTIWCTSLGQGQRNVQPKLKYWIDNSKYNMNCILRNMHRYLQQHAEVYRFWPSQTSSRPSSVMLWVSMIITGNRHFPAFISWFVLFQPGSWNFWNSFFPTWKIEELYQSWSQNPRWLLHASAVVKAAVNTVYYTVPSSFYMWPCFCVICECKIQHNVLLTSIGNGGQLWLKMAILAFF